MGKSSPFSSADSDSDSDDGINMELLREATDQELINDSMFKEAGSTEQKPTRPEAVKSQPKSQRYIDTGDRVVDDLKIPESMQTFVYKKLSQILADQIEFVEVKQRIKSEKDPKPVVRLLSDTDPIVLREEELSADTIRKEKRKRPHIGRRKVEVDELSEKDKLQAATATPADITADANRVERKANERNIYRYKAIQSKLYLIEPDTEFTKLRKKNNWSESKIARK